MIPFKDNVPRVHPPVAVFILLGLNSLAFLLELSLPKPVLFELFHVFGAVPARFVHPDWAEWMGYPDLGWLPLFTYQFLHSGWMHIILNMWMLWIFADNVEDVMGHFGFLVFFLLCGAAALVLQLVFEPDSTVPVVGASGAIAGVMGAYFILYPHGRVYTFIPIFFFIPLIIKLPAVVFLGVWMAIQVVSGVFAKVSGQASDIAWWAHIGGFAAGILLLPLFRRKDRCHHCWDTVKKDYAASRDRFDFD